MRSGSRVNMTLGFANHAALKALAERTVEPDGIELTCITRFHEPWMINLTESILSGKLDGGVVGSISITRCGGVDRDIIGGKDPYQCGLGPSERRTIEALIGYLMLDQAISAGPPLDELFPPL